jgi:hypothetical protein
VVVKITFAFAGVLAPIWLLSQITLINPSFEGDKPQDACVPAGWQICKQGSTPDILPGVWGVFTEASDGDTFVGLITRADGTWESIGQRLSAPLAPNECYALTLDLAFSKAYAGYNKPVKLRVWGGKNKCGRDQIIAQSGFIDHADWETYTFQFVPKETINYVIIEAHYTDEPGFSHQGNILIDHIRPIRICIRA